jgi:hypothetical protein
MRTIIITTLHKKRQKDTQVQLYKIIAACLQRETWITTAGNRKIIPVSEMRFMRHVDGVRLLDKQ